MLQVNFNATVATVQPRVFLRDEQRAIFHCPFLLSSLFPSIFGT